MDLKTSLLVNRQLPEFIREEYPIFISFLEAYYEFLETERYIDNVNQKNNLTEKLKDLRNLSDIDFSLNDFEEQFFNTFASYLPKETTVSKDFLIKNILPLYQSKGTQKSFQLLFRLLFGEEIEILFPKENVLRASDGKWVIENIIRTEVEVYSEYISNGSKTVYNLPYEIDPLSIEIYVNDVLFENYYIRKELQKIYFNETIPLNSIIKVYYTDTFNLSIFQNRQIKGKTTGSTAIVEKVARRSIAGLNFYQFFVDQKNIVGEFRNGEIVEIDIIKDNGAIIPFSLQTISDVLEITVVNPGKEYEVGNSVILRGPSTEQAIAIVDKVSTGNIESLFVKVGNFGAGYKVGNEIYANNFPSNVFSAIIDAVDDSGTISPNVFVYNVDLISDFLSTNISDPDYAISNISSNLSSVIGNSLTLNIVTNVGPATNVLVSLSQIASNSNVEFLANSTLLSNSLRISDYNSIGTIKVVLSGSGYSVGDEIIFNNTEYFSGQGAKAFVSSVNPSGGITGVRVTDGGYNYRKDYLPSLSVDSVGTGAILEVEHFMGQDAEFEYEIGDGIQGKILSIRVLSPGKGYTSTPFVDLKFSGDGTATAVANVRSSFVKLPGKWITSDGLLSTDDIRLQGENYYVDFSYVISSQVEFQRYKNVVKDLLNPAGSVAYARYRVLDDVQSNVAYLAFDEITRQIAGTVNVSTSLEYVFGPNSYFVVANTIGLLELGTYILVNSEIRIVNSIINNTTITISEPYDYSGNLLPITLLTVPYRAISTEYLREVAITIEGPRTIVLTTEE